MIKFVHSSCAQEALLYLRILRVRRSLNSVQNQQDRQLLVLRIVFLVLVLGFHVVGIDCRDKLRYRQLLYFILLLGFWIQATMLYFKRNITCASKCVCYYEGTLKQFNAPSARMLQTNQHIESSQPQILHKESESSFCPSAMHDNMAAQNKMREGSHHVHAKNKIEGNRPANSTQTDMSFTPFFICLTQDSSGSHNIYQASCSSWHSMSRAM